MSIRENKTAKKPCPVCGGKLKKGAKKYCSNGCARSRHPRKWTEAELDYLDKIAGKYPPEIMAKQFLTRSYQQRRNGENWIKRTHEQVIQKIRSLGLNTHPSYVETYLSRMAIADNLGIPRTRIPKLISLGMPVTKCNRISTREVRNWLSWNKNLLTAKPWLKDGKEEFLRWWLGDVITTRMLKAPDMYCIKREIKITFRGIAYPSTEKAAEAMHVSAACLRRAIKKGANKVAGIEFVFEEIES